MATLGMTPHRYTPAGKGMQNTPITHRIAPAFTSSIAPTVTAAAERTMMGEPVPDRTEGVSTSAAAVAAAAAEPAKAPEAQANRQPEEPALHWINRIRLNPTEARTGIILMEILGEPVSKKRRTGRWR